MDIMDTIKEQVESNTILLYMKGSPDQPQCGFSAQASQILMACGERFAYIDILANPDIRANLPQYSNWPTFPQLFVEGELVGGCDIITEMYQNGELQPLIKAAGQSATAADVPRCRAYISRTQAAPGCASQRASQASRTFARGSGYKGPCGGWTAGINSAAGPVHEVIFILSISFQVHNCAGSIMKFIFSGNADLTTLGRADSQRAIPGILLAKIDPCGLNTVCVPCLDTEAV